MRIRNVVHKGLRNLIEKDDRSGLPALGVDKIRRIVLFLQDMHHEAELESAHVDRQPQRRMEPVRHQELAHHISDRWPRH
jgi:hypothetical protein